MNPTAKIVYTVGKSGRVWLRVFDASGRVIRTLVDQYLDARDKPYEVIWDGTNDRGQRVSSGVFLYQLEAAGYRSAKKIVILR
jgi:flagellar hook assembly protein FlgD